jgi:hypothetical protein
MGVGLNAKSNATIPSVPRDIVFLDLEPSYLHANPVRPSVSIHFCTLTTITHNRASDTALSASSRHNVTVV